MKKELKKYWVLILTIIIIFDILTYVFIVHLFLIYDWTGLTQINHEYELSTGGYPRMLHINDSLLVAYHNGSIVLSEINMNNGTISTPIKIIPGGNRPMLMKDSTLSRVVCIFNKEGMESGASIGIAHVLINDYSNASAWVIQERLLGPVEQPFRQIGLWEPYILPIDSTHGDYLLFFSNQTIYDPDNPIDSYGYYYEEEGNRMNQQISVYWLNWNGTAYEETYAGALSENLNGENIFEKDGMASVIQIEDNAFLATFETFPSMRFSASVKILKFKISTDGKIETLWRKSLSDDAAAAPYLVLYKNKYVCSYHSYNWLSHEVKLVSMDTNEIFISKYTFLPNFPIWWGSLYVDNTGSLWYAGRDDNSDLVNVINFEYIPQFSDVINYLQVFALLFGANLIIILFLRKIYAKLKNKK